MNDNNSKTLLDFQEYIEEVLTKRIQDLYLSDKVPWVVGYSGGKDSTATLQLVWNAVAKLPLEQRNHKTIYVISTNTLVEPPVVAKWVDNSLLKMRQAAGKQGLLFDINQLTPEFTDSYWVLLIGKGYPAPRPNFRWCTDRLKIKPADRFITRTIAKHGEVILVLGTRHAESSKRAFLMRQYEQKRVREYLSPTKKLINCLTYTPIEDWSDHDVWAYLLNYSNPWGQANEELLTMYEGATADGECPLVLDTNTPSCGNSRFGCWVCTMINEDKSMQAMIENDENKIWMKPLLNLRNELGNFPDRDKRDFRRMRGQILLHKDRAVHGPYTKKWREHWLRRLLETEKQIQEFATGDFKKIKLISDEELQWIRKIWVIEKHEFDDILPTIYEEVTGNKYPYCNDVKTVFGSNEWNLLREICDEDNTLFELQTILLDITQRHYGFIRRQGVMREIEGAIKRCYYEDENDAVRVAQEKKDLETKVKEADLQELLNARS